MISRRQALTFMGAATGSILAPAGSAALDLDPEPLKDIAKAKGLRFGNAMGMLGDENRRERFYNPAYRALMARECAMIVAENETKWQALQPRPGPYDFRAADEMFAWARKEGMLIRGHTMMWQSPKWLPGWINELDLASQPATRTEGILREHISTVCRRLGKDVISYDVINEAVAPESGALIDNVFSKRLGAVDQIDLAFRLTREYAPNAQLVYNDYMGPSAGNATHRAGVLKLLSQLKVRGTPIDALGLQSHIGIHDAMTASPAGKHAAREWRKFLDEVTGMGYDLLVSEFDVSDKGMPANTITRDAATAALARDYLELTLSYPNCRDFLLWGLSDNVSWLQEWQDARRPDRLPQRPTPYDSRLRPKPMRAAIAQVMRSIPTRKA
ncbi:endo-1,4-beta-xylanase [Massilia sp. HP4]|uniref:endo-1,4-beta-xylanase n=1 Tax=Massilia sp. HP4 TaxID=2562316 RepID=UPI0010BF96C1|nr:endo-1,4-beta-xylanase [Massilia sp. HP4]